MGSRLVPSATSKGRESSVRTLCDKVLTCSETRIHLPLLPNVDHLVTSRLTLLGFSLCTPLPLPPSPRLDLPTLHSADRDEQLHQPVDLLQDQGPTPDLIWLEHHSLLRLSLLHPSLLLSLVSNRLHSAVRDLYSTTLPLVRWNNIMMNPTSHPTL
jgi:hypothetical protein